MPSYVWLVFLIWTGLLVWCFVDRFRKGRRIAALQQAIREAKRTIRQLEDNHGLKQSGRQQTEEKLRSYLRLLDTLINTMSNPVCFKDTNGFFQGCNQVFAKTVLGLTRDRIIGRRSQDMPDRIPPDLAATYQRQEMVMFEKGGVHAFEAQVRCADGIPRDFLFSLAPIKSPKGDAVGSVAVLSDLTEKNRAARDRLTRERLEGVLETAGGVCHEFNQPLQALSGFLEILAVKVAFSDEAASVVEKALTQVNRMGTITDKLQGITRYETMNYGKNAKIIDIHKSSRPAVGGIERPAEFKDP